MHLQIGFVLSIAVFLAACRGDSLPRTVTYNNEEALPGCDSLDDRTSETARKEALDFFNTESSARSTQWELSRASRCDGRILVRIMVAEGVLRQPFFVQMDESFSHKEIQRPE